MKRRKTRLCTCFYVVFRPAPLFVAISVSFQHLHKYTSAPRTFILEQSSQQQNPTLKSSPQSTSPTNFYHANPPNMQLQLPILLSLLTTTIALPTSTDDTSIAPASNNTNPSILEKRYHYGWIGSFPSNDCHGKNVGPRPKLESYNLCYKFTSPREATHIGINFGSGWYQMDAVKFYTDDNCKTLASKSSNGGYYNQKDGKDGYGCTGEFRNVRSVMAASVNGV